MCVLDFSANLSEMFFKPKRIQRDINIKGHSCEVGVSVILVRIWIKKMNFLNRFRINIKRQISWKSVQLEPSFSMRTDVQRGRHDEASSRFPQFCQRAPKQAIIW